jgi:hypothetical protein
LVCSYEAEEEKILEGSRMVKKVSDWGWNVSAARA